MRWEDGDRLLIFVSKGIVEEVIGETLSCWG
jgi:hypothetical protein